MEYKYTILWILKGFPLNFRWTCAICRKEVTRMGTRDQRMVDVCDLGGHGSSFAYAHAKCLKDSSQEYLMTHYDSYMRWNHECQLCKEVVHNGLLCGKKIKVTGVYKNTPYRFKGEVHAKCLDSFNEIHDQRKTRLLDEQYWSNVDNWAREYSDVSNDDIVDIPL
jgi:hypothetical protein